MCSYHRVTILVACTHALGLLQPRPREPLSASTTTVSGQRSMHWAPYMLEWKGPVHQPPLHGQVASKTYRQHLFRQQWSVDTQCWWMGTGGRETRARRDEHRGRRERRKRRDTCRQNHSRRQTGEGAKTKKNHERIYIYIKCATAEQPTAATTNTVEQNKYKNATADYRLNTTD